LGTLSSLLVPGRESPWSCSGSNMVFLIRFVSKTKHFVLRTKCSGKRDSKQQRLLATVNPKSGSSRRPINGICNRVLVEISGAAVNSPNVSVDAVCSYTVLYSSSVSYSTCYYIINAAALVA
jgi:hypothetical protein